MNNEYNKQNNGGQNRQFNNNEKNVTRENTAGLTCTCCEESKKGFAEKAMEVGKTALNTVTTHPVESALITLGAIVTGGYIKNGIKRKKEGMSFWHTPKVIEVPVTWVKGVFTKKTVEEPAPAAEAPAEEQK